MIGCIFLKIHKIKIEKKIPRQQHCQCLSVKFSFDPHSDEAKYQTKSNPHDHGSHASNALAISASTTMMNSLHLWIGIGKSEGEFVIWGSSREGLEQSFWGNVSRACSSMPFPMFQNPVFIQTAPQLLPVYIWA